MNVLKLVFLCVLLLAAGCGDDDGDPAAPESPTTVVRTGTVTAVDDRTPVDGGITIDLLLDDGGTERAYFPSLFTSPPPGEDLMRLYDVVRRVEIGDRVRVEGMRSEAGGIDLDSLWILDGSF